MARQKWNLNTIYISERLKACLRPVTCCALTTMVAPMGYGKTTAINWFLDEQGEMDAPHTGKRPSYKVGSNAAYSQNTADDPQQTILLSVLKIPYKPATIQLK